jgi:hypothetical protein
MFPPPQCGYRPVQYAPYGYMPNPFPVYAPPNPRAFFGPGPYPVYGPPQTGWPVFTHVPPGQLPPPPPPLPPPPQPGDVVNVPDSSTGPYQFWTAPPPVEAIPLHETPPVLEEVEVDHPEAEHEVEVEHVQPDHHGHWHSFFSHHKQGHCYHERCWVSAQYLNWWLRPAPLPVPLLTTGAATPTGGVIGDPSTVVLFGNAPLNFSVVPGGRVGLGFWLDSEHVAAIEMSGFLLAQTGRTFAVASDTIGDPKLLIPFVDAATGTEQGIRVADPVFGFVGSAAVTASSQFYGADINGVLRVADTPTYSVDFLLGFRYFGLDEDLELRAQSTSTGTGVSYAGIDRFRTENNFYGGQLGTRISWRWWRIAAELTGLVALGTNEQHVNISGATTVTGDPLLTTPGTFPGFIFTQPTNIGSFKTRDFSIAPQAQIKVGMDLLARLRATVGYDFLYWSDVVRPGNQIDRVVNFSQAAPLLGGSGTGLVGPARPAPLNNRSDFWAHGINFGLEFRW